MSILITIVTIPFKVIGYLFKHPKLAIIGVVGVVLIFGVKACSDTFGGNNQVVKASVEVPAYAKIAPDIKLAPYVVKTYTRLYYAETFFVTSDRNSVTIRGYWTYDSKAWIKHSEDLVMAKKYYPAVTLFDRASNKVLVSF